MSTYLSVDIDYWTHGQGQRAACTRLIHKILNLGVPTLVVLNHQEMLKDVDRSGCDRIEHVDYHSDVVDSEGYPGCPEKPLFDEGSWLSFVEWRHQGELTWRMPSLIDCYDKGWGTCHDAHNPFVKPVSGWRSIKKRQGWRGLPWHDIARVGIAISYYYWSCQETYRSVLAELLGTKTFEAALRKAQQGRLPSHGRRIRRAA